LPRPLTDRPGMDMSFSGLKTAVVRARDQIANPDGSLNRQDVADLCAGFQAAVSDVLVHKTRRALDAYLALVPRSPAVAVAGGVAANQTICSALSTLAAEHDVAFAAPPLALCTDNAAMIAFAGGLLHRCGHKDDLTLKARPRWPLDTTQAAMLGSGKKGPKA
ncbi:MAG: tRNA (adenosine(37)-N6)-threonylcarbamoyltransferase complex transferase subunit TsaD, partial [Pseudomonadota bacterium]